MQSTGLLVVDVQPAYDDNCGYLATEVAKRINNTKLPTIVMWVGEGLTSDTEEDVRAYLSKHGARPGKLAQCEFIEKDYGFFRPWMDNGVDRDLIHQTGMALFKQKHHTSEDLDLFEVLGADAVEVPYDDHLMWPSFDASRMEYLNHFKTCGGGSTECLAEVELWLGMTGRTYTRLDHLVYGN